MLYLGIDIGGMSIKGGIVDEEGKILVKDTIPTGNDRDQKNIVSDIARLASDLIKRNRNEVKDIKSIGIGSPGTPDSDEGTIVYANNINFKNAPIRKIINEFIELPVYVDNDANCAALAESTFGAAKDVKHSVMITIGTGIGAGVIIDNKIYSGFNFAASEMGHMVIILDGEKCTCGRKGCWERYASATALINQTKMAAHNNKDSIINELIKGNLDKVDAKVAFTALREGDYTAKIVINKYVKYLSEGLINVINSLQPNVVVIGGGVSNEGDNLLNPVRNYVSQHVYSKNVKQTEIRKAQMGNDAGIIGAAMLGKNVNK